MKTGTMIAAALIGVIGLLVTGCKTVNHQTTEVRGEIESLEGLNWKPKWTTHLGCLKGCLDYLNVEMTDAWLFGVSGHAFVMNIHEELCPSGPTAWKSKQMMELCENVGCRLDVVSAHKSHPKFPKVQEEAWRKVRAAIDSRTPCYAWELDIPEFYVIHGYDETGYYYRGPRCDSGKGPLPWEKLGDTGIGIIELVIVKPANPLPDKEAVKEALVFATAFGRDSRKWTHDKYKGGLEAYDLWIESLQNNRADGFGTAYNAVVWAECRSHAVRFLMEARERLDTKLSPLFDDAIAHYTQVATSLREVSQTFPFMDVSDEQKKENVQDEDRRKAAIASLEAARTAEGKGLAVLQRIAEKL